MCFFVIIFLRYLTAGSVRDEWRFFLHSGLLCSEINKQPLNDTPTVATSFMKSQIIVIKEQKTYSFLWQLLLSGARRPLRLRPFKLAAVVINAPVVDTLSRPRILRQCRHLVAKVAIAGNWKLLLYLQLWPLSFFSFRWWSLWESLVLYVLVLSSVSDASWFYFLKVTLL